MAPLLPLPIPQVHSTVLGLAIAEKALDGFLFKKTTTSLISVAAGRGWKTFLAFPICLDLCGAICVHFDVTLLGLLMSLHPSSPMKTDMFGLDGSNCGMCPDVHFFQR